MYMTAQMYVYHVCVRCLWRQEGVRATENGVIGHFVGARNWTLVPWKSSKPSLQAFILRERGGEGEVCV